MAGIAASSIWFLIGAGVGASVVIVYSVLAVASEMAYETERRMEAVDE